MAVFSAWCIPPTLRSRPAPPIIHHRRRRSITARTPTCPAARRCCTAAARSPGVPDCSTKRKPNHPQACSLARSPLRSTHPLQTLFATPIETRLAIQTAVAPCTRADVHSPPTDRAAAKSTRVELPCPRGYPEPTQSLPSAYLELTQSLPSAIKCHMPCVSSPLCHEPPAVSAAEERAEPPDSGRPNGSLCGTRQRRERKKKRDPGPKRGKREGWMGKAKRARALLAGRNAVDRSTADTTTSPCSGRSPGMGATQQRSPPSWLAGATTSPLGARPGRGLWT